VQKRVCSSAVYNGVSDDRSGSNQSVLVRSGSSPVCSFNPTRLTCRNKLDGDGRRYDVLPSFLMRCTWSPPGSGRSNERKTPRPPGSPHRTSHQLMFGQVSGCGASILRFDFSGSCGTSWTATVAAGSVELSLRMMCSSPSPGSTNVSPAL
jgi:hypothetical protein